MEMSKPLIKFKLQFIETIIHTTSVSHAPLHYKPYCTYRNRKISKNAKPTI